MPQLSKVPPTPKLGSVSLPPDSPHDDTGKIFGGSRKRLTSFFGKAMPTINVGRSMTPVPAPVTRCEYPRSQPAGKSRPRASSMTNRPVALQEHALNPDLNAIMPRYSEPSRGGSSKVRQYPIDSMSQSWTASARPPLVAPGRHQGPDTPKYMKATVKEVATKDESIVLSWPLVPYADRRQLKHPLLYYDVAFDPRDTNNVRDNRKTHFLALPEADRELPVSTHCTLTEMVIDCPLVGSLVVARPEGLRCIDVFYAIYCKYQKKPRSHERPADTAKYMPAFEQRCHDCPGLPEYNRRLGLLRVDLLRGKRIFEGLRRANGRWELIIDVPPKQRI